jgi:hypothetical protein
MVQTNVFHISIQMNYIACDDEHVCDANAHALDDNACLTPRGVTQVPELVGDEVELAEGDPLARLLLFQFVADVEDESHLKQKD